MNELVSEEDQLLFETKEIHECLLAFWSVRIWVERRY